jgi:hypothetical protein
VNDKLDIDLVIDETTMLPLRGALFTPDGCENFAVLLCGTAVTKERTRLLAREWIAAPSSAYTERLSYHLEITPGFLNSIVDRAIATGLSPVLVHSHPVAESARYSTSDDYGEGRLLPILEQLLPGRVVASLLLTPDDARGRVVRRGRFVALSGITIIGKRVIAFGSRAERAWSAEGAVISALFDRQTRAIGDIGMSRIRALRVAVVGVGGTGSAVIEQLVRLGVQDVTIVDPDVLEPSNLSRVWGALPADADMQRAKVDIAADHARAIAPGIRVQALQDSIVRQSVLIGLRDRDLLFGCTDNHWSRAVLNRFAHQYLVPLIDMGVRLDARNGAVTAAAGQVTIAGAGRSCLRCSQLIDADRIRFESMPRAERQKLIAEGYVLGSDEPAPSVISLNTTIASMAVTAALSLFVNLTGAAPPSGIRYDATTSTTFVVDERHDSLCDICSKERGIVGLGDIQPVSAYE